MAHGQGEAMLAAKLGHNRQAQRWALFGVMALAVGLRLWGLARESLWFDEAYSVAFGRQPLAAFSLISLQGMPFADRNLYDLFLHFWLLIAGGDWWVRLPSALFGSATVYVVYRLGAALWDEWTGLLAGLLLAVSPFHVWYSQEVRMYALVALLAAVGSWLFWRLLHEDRFGQSVGYVVAMALALYTHSFALFVLLYHNLYIALGYARRQVSGRLARRWLLAQLALTVLYLPWLRGILSQQGQGWWAWIDVQYGPATLRSLLRALADLSYGGRIGRPPLVGYGLLLVFVALLLPGALRRSASPSHWQPDPGWGYAAGLLAVPVGVVFIASQYRNMFIPRYLVPFVPGLVLLVAHGISRLPWRALQAGAVAVVLAASTFALVDAQTRQYKEDWRGVAARIAAEEQAGDLIVLQDGDICIPFGRYYRGLAAIKEVRTGETEPGMLADLLDQAVAAHPRIWLVMSHTRDPNLQAALVADRRLRQAFAESFPGVSVARFDRLP